MNKPERLPAPDLADWLPAGLRAIASAGDNQQVIPRIAKDAALTREVEACLPSIPTHHDLWHGDARALDFIADSSVHLVLISPPYWTLKEYRHAPGQMGDMADKVAFDDGKFKPGDEVASMMVAPFTGDRGDIACMVAFGGGKRTVELSRKLNTGSPTDVQFDNLDAAYPFGLATFDNAQVRHAFAFRPVKLMFGK